MDVWCDFLAELGVLTITVTAGVITQDLIVGPVTSCLKSVFVAFVILVPASRIASQLSRVPGRRVFQEPNTSSGSKRRHACELIRGMQRPSENLAIGHGAFEPVLSCLIRSSSSQR